MDTVQTRFGAVTVEPTQADHIFVSFSTGSRGETPLTLRGVEWSGSAHFYLHGADGWRIGQQSKSDYERRQSLHLSRCGECKSYQHSQPTPAAFQAIATELTAVIRPWAEAHIIAIAAAQVEHLREELEKLDNEILEQRSGLNVLELRRQTLVTELEAR